ncbi:hypothetical protein [Ferrimonas sp. SCSIO 43195]|uniref:hypothetical protein n=1 Tax=Ferrimonas sp. SCSIO 43195 TaxID=2822844 RepID=UPI0020753B67|nr:hypothetical protein [Ferrimonas sp. SCSIO 43195]USD37281.1 hypothetical protein J8Z22_20230 [Ferrimonas sp. SCSIO 43195]
MSVINKMLKDLDQDQRQRIVHPNLVSMPSSPSARQPRNWWWLVLLLSVVAAGLSWYSLWPNLSGRAETLLAQAPASATAQEAAEPLPMAPAVTPAVSVVSELEPAQVPATSVPAIETVAAANNDAAANTSKANAPATAAAAGPTVRTEAAIEPEQRQAASIEQAPMSAPAAVAPKAEPKVVAVAEVVAPKPKPVMVVTPAALTSEQQAQQFLAQAQQRQGGTDLLKQALALDPQLHEARVLLAERQAATDLGTALVTLAKASQAYPLHSEYPLLAAELSQQAGQDEQAKLWLGQLAQKPLTSELLARRAAVAQGLSMLTMAVSDYQALTQAQPEQGRWWLGLAYSLDRMGQYSKALPAYQRAARTNTLSTSARQYIDQRLKQLGEAG